MDKCKSHNRNFRGSYKIGRDTQKERATDDRGRNGSYAARNQGTPGAHLKLEKAGQDSLLEPLERVWPCLDLGLLVSKAERINSFGLNHRVCGNVLAATLGDSNSK